MNLICALVDLISDPKNDKVQCVARGGLRLERVREPVAKARVIRVGGPVVFKKQWVVGHQSETTLAV
jgi:hypothetical protein